jgi:hypothetical protein
MSVHWRKAEMDEPLTSNLDFIVRVSGAYSCGRLQVIPKL